MSHQTGIRANQELKKFFGKCNIEDIRVFKIAIIEEELTLAASKYVDDKWDHDSTMIKELVEDEQPCYILYRLDTKNSSSSYEWILIFWSPDNSAIRQKMLYASTKATLKQEFGTANIKEEIHATVLADISSAALVRAVRSEKSPAPLTEEEQQLLDVRRNEAQQCGVNTRQQTMGSVAFPVTESVRTALNELAQGNITYVQLAIDLEKEIIVLDRSLTIATDQLAKQVPENQARYHIFNFKHTHEGDYLESLVFIYSMPGYSTPIKERMLYSSCKGSLIDFITQEYGLEIAKKIEIDDGTELNQEFLQDEIHPKKMLHRPKFAKPKGPPSRGAKRLTKNQDQDVPSS